MGKLFKLIFVLLIAGGIFLLTPAGKNFQAKTISIINPAIAGAEDIKKAKQNLSTITKTINGPAGKNLSPAEKTTIKNAISATGSFLDDAQEHIDQSNISASIASLISKIIPNTNPTPTPASCPNP